MKQLFGFLGHSEIIIILGQKREDNILELSNLNVSKTIIFLYALIGMTPFLEGFLCVFQNFTWYLSLILKFTDV